MIIKPAHPSDSELLTNITKKSKAYWGYSGEQMDIWSEALTITEAYIETNSVYKLVLDNLIIGYYSFFYENENTIRLDNLFILPDYIGKGYGQLLMEDLLLRITAMKIKKIVLHADPNAERFYLKFGFTTTGRIENFNKDRYLPVMELNSIS